MNAYARRPLTRRRPAARAAPTRAKVPAGGRASASPVLLVDRLLRDAELICDLLPRPALCARVANVQRLELFKEAPERGDAAQTDFRVGALGLACEFRGGGHAVNRS